MLAYEMCWTPDDGIGALCARTGALQSYSGVAVGHLVFFFVCLFPLLRVLLDKQGARVE